jgi:hypothetical protein
MMAATMPKAIIGHSPPVDEQTHVLAKVLYSPSDPFVMAIDCIGHLGRVFILPVVFVSSLLCGTCTLDDAS